MAMPTNQQKRIETPKTQSTAPTIIARLNDVATRLRVSEERINQNKARIRIYDDEILNNKKLITEYTESINDDLTTLRKDIKNINDTIHYIIKELELTAKKQELTVMEKYVNLMDPTRYVTKEDFKRIMKEVISKNGK